MTNELPPLDLESSTVHDALAKASSSSRSQDAMKNFSVRIPVDVKEKAQEICETHATDLGTYLRECAKALVDDYGHKVPNEG